MYPAIARARFAISPHIAIIAMCHSVTSVNLYSPCLFATRSAFALISNSKIASQRRFPFVKRTRRRGSHTIGIGDLK